MGGLTAAELAPIRGRLEAFTDDLFASLLRADQRARGQCYLRGLMLDGRRKSIQPLAARLGEVPYQALHHFVAAYYQAQPLTATSVGGLESLRDPGSRQHITSPLLELGEQENRRSA